MSKLSPAAQQVFWEFNRAARGKPDDWHYLPAIAAVLRAVVQELKYFGVTEKNILAIAAEYELEAQ
jgi:hypothetical protein